MLVLLSTLLIGNADAKKMTMTKPYMYGWGASVHTMMFPFSYPPVFPDVRLSEEDGGVVDSDGTITATDLNLNDVNQDLGFGPKFTMYLNKMYRFSAYPYAHFGANESGYRSLGISLEGDRSALVEQNIIAFYGLGVGSSLFWFDQEMENNVDVSLTGNQLFAKAQVGGIYFDKVRAYELSMYVKLALTGLEELDVGNTTYTPSLNQSEEGLTQSLYTPTFGIQATYYVGDFRKITQKKGKKKKGKKKKR